MCHHGPEDGGEQRVYPDGMQEHRRLLPGAVGVCLEELMGEEGGAEAKRYPLVTVRLQVTDHLQRITTVHLRQLGTQQAQHRRHVSTGSRELPC